MAIKAYEENDYARRQPSGTSSATTFSEEEKESSAQAPDKVGGIELYDVFQKPAS